MLIVILLVIAALVVATPVVLYKVAPGLLPGKVKEILDGIMGGGEKGKEDTDAGSSSSPPAGKAEAEGGKDSGTRRQ